MVFMVRKRNGQFVCSNKIVAFQWTVSVGPATYNALMGAPRSTKAVLTQNAATKAVATKSAFTNNNATSRRIAGQSINGQKR